jgi:DNA mismatch repair protein MutS
MFKRTHIMHVIAFASLLNIGYTLTNEATQAVLLTNHVANQYVNGIFKKPEPAPAEEKQEPTGWLEKYVKSSVGDTDPKTAILTPRETQEVAFDIAATNKFETSIIDSSFVDKLEVVNGGESSSNHLFAIIFKDYINTTIGKAYAALTFCHPISDIATLNNRAQSIAHFNKNKKLANALTATLQQITPVEEQSLLFWHSKPIANQELLKQAYFGQMLSGLNTNTIALESMGRGLQLLLGTISIGSLPASIAAQIYTLQYSTNESIKVNIKIHGFSAVQKHIMNNLGIHIEEENARISFKDATKIFTDGMNQLMTPSQQIGAAATLFTIQVASMYPVYCQFKATKAIYAHIQNIMIATATHVNALKKISSIISKDKQLLQYLPSLQPLADFNNPTKHSSKLNKLLGMLDTNTFKGEASFWSITGRVLAAHELMKQVKDELAPIFAAAGELDMYVALAKVYGSREDKEARYCMVNFVENSTTPIIEAQNFWNPFINPDIVVVNNAKFDATQPNSILTGPNTGGKSTVIKGIMINALMAQTFGIAPSSSLTITPLNKLNCFMNISDDIAMGASLFKSEVMRAKKLLDMVQALQPNEFSFVIIDEVFTGTSPVEGEMAALQFTKRLGTYPNNTSIIATHYPKMVDLEVETNGTYRNNHVEILRNEDNSLNRTFKLKSGPSFFNVAFDILEEEGLFV